MRKSSNPRSSKGSSQRFSAMRNQEHAHVLSFDPKDFEPRSTSKNSSKRRSSSKRPMRIGSQSKARSRQHNDNLGVIMEQNSPYFSPRDTLNSTNSHWIKNPAVGKFQVFMRGADEV
jgi:hypothetical protein